MIEKLEEILKRYLSLQKEMEDPNLIKDLNKYKKINKEFSELSLTVEVYEKYKKTLKEIDESEYLLQNETDEEILNIAKEDLENLKKNKLNLEEKLKELLVPKDPNDDRNTIMEIRAGTGGDEAGLFCADLYKMYLRYAEKKYWKTELLSLSENGIGGFKEVIFIVVGNGAYGNLRFESGGHRVQRVPETESGGRIHTSACTVAVLKEADDIEIDIKDSDIRIDVYRSSGAGGQSVNTTDSAVRITHLPTGITVACQDERSQHKNKAKALKILKARILEIEEEKQKKEILEDRKTQVGTGDRSDRIRTYNFPQNRVTDHRINLTLYTLSDFMLGDLDFMIEELKRNHRDVKL